MSILKNESEITRLRQSGKQLARIISLLKSKVAVGVLPRDLDALAREEIKKISGRPAFLNYRPPGSSTAYPAALCVSVNADIVHGIPSDIPFVAGDIITLDLGLELDGLITDMAVTVALPPVAKEVNKLMAATYEALMAGIRATKPGGKTGDIGFAIESKIKKTNYGLVRDLTGHGVGFSVHEPPAVPNFGRAGTGSVLKVGQVLAIEPMATLGRGEIKLLDDNFTFSTKDDSLSAHFEHTVIINQTGVEIITQNK